MSRVTWTASLVEERLAEAADVLKRLPEVRMQGYFSLWPRILHDAAELAAQESKRLNRPPPKADAISRMEEVLTWSKWLEPDDAKLVWARAENLPWKTVCWRFGVSRVTAWRRWVMALCILANRLNKNQ